MRTSAHIFTGGVFAAPRYSDLLLAWSMPPTTPTRRIWPGATPVEPTETMRSPSSVPRSTAKRRPRVRYRPQTNRRRVTERGPGRRTTDARIPRDRSTDEHHLHGSRRPRPRPRARAFSRSPPTDCWRTATPPRWWTATARSAGCACPAMTAPRCSRRSSIRPAGTGGSVPPATYRSERRYLPGTLVIETTFTTETGSVKLTDAMAFAEGQRDHELGMGAPHLLLRCVEGVSRRGGARAGAGAEAGVRARQAAVPPDRERRADVRRARTRSCSAPGVDCSLEDSTMRARFTVSGRRAGRVRAAVGRRRRRRRPSRSRPSGSPRGSRTRSQAWRSWEAEHDIYEGPHRELVRLSARVLKGLTYRPDRRDRRRADRPRCPRRSAASATGTTATRGSATRA